jgi:omega-amidase
VNVSPADVLGVVVVQPPAWTPDGDRNLDAIRAALDATPDAIQPGDLLVLPELVGASMDHARYLRRIQDTARALGVWVVGGSHHHSTRGRTVNTGAVAGPDGDLVATYDKHHPYGVDTEGGVDPGDRLGAFEVRGRQVLVLICADFWHSALLHTTDLRPDVIAVPSFSVSRLRPPTPARVIWRHMAISRAYEFGAYVAISDWATSATFAGDPSAGAAGIAHPYPGAGQRLFEPLGRRRIARRRLDVAVTDHLRDDRANRRFLTRAVSASTPGENHPATSGRVITWHPRSPASLPGEPPSVIPRHARGRRDRRALPQPLPTSTD